MTMANQPGPLVIWGQNPPIQPGGAPPDYNADYGPSLVAMGFGLIDPRFGNPPGGAGNGSAQAFGFGAGVNYVGVDQVPSLATTANISALANAVSGTPVALVSATGAGITVMTVPFVNQASGYTVPAVLAIDGIPAFVKFGQSLALQFFDPTKMLARAVSITGVAGGTGGNFTVRGYDVYGQPMSETIAATAGATTVNGKKAFKFVASGTPAFSDAHNYSVGTADVYGLPFLASSYGYVNATFNNAPVTAPGFVAGDATAVTATTGDVRGTITSTSDGTKRLQIMQGVSLTNLATLAPGVFTGLFGVTNFTN